MAKKKRTPRKLSWKEALVVIALAMILSLIRQATMPGYDMVFRLCIEVRP